MTDEQINEAIAKACGWKWVQNYYWLDSNGLNAFAWDIPDYCNDLNAMAEAEETLSKEQIEVYCDAMWPKGHGWWWAIHTTARQRAEAFLRTLGKWEEVQG